MEVDFALVIMFLYLSAILNYQPYICVKNSILNQEKKNFFVVLQIITTIFAIWKNVLTGGRFSMVDFELDLMFLDFSAILNYQPHSSVKITACKKKLIYVPFICYLKNIRRFIRCSHIHFHKSLKDYDTTLFFYIKIFHV